MEIPNRFGQFCTSFGGITIDSSIVKVEESFIDIKSENLITMEFDQSKVLKLTGGLFRDAVQALVQFFCEAINPIDAKKKFDNQPWETHVGLRCVHDCLLVYQDWLGQMVNFAKMYGFRFDMEPFLYYDYKGSFRKIIGTKAEKAVRALSKMIKRNGFDNDGGFKSLSDGLIRKIKTVNREIPQILIKREVVSVKNPLLLLERGDFVEKALTENFKAFADVFYKPEELEEEEQVQVKQEVKEEVKEEEE